MVTSIDANDLAQLSLGAYSDTPTGLPAGFATRDPSNLYFPLAPGETFSNGVFHSGNGAALVTLGTFENAPAIVVAFRGSDDSIDSQQDLNGINAAYASFNSLVSAVDTAASLTGLPVVVTGHSLGGAMAQLYMASHPDQPGGPIHEAVTFGSPGAILPEGTDARITNFVIADDPAVVLGAHRAEIGDLLRSDPTLASLVAARIAPEFPGLTRQEALASLSNLTANYDNRGDIVLLPGQDGRMDPSADVANLAQADAARHAPELYVQEVANTATPGGSVVVPEAPTTDPVLNFLQQLYDGGSHDPAFIGSILQDLGREWASGLIPGFSLDASNALEQAATSLGQYAQDQQLV